MDNNNVTGARNLQLVDVVRRSGLQARNLMLLAEQATAPPAALGPTQPAQQGNEQVSPAVSDATHRGAIEVVRLECQNALRTLAQEDAAALSVTALGPPPPVQQGTVTPPASATATAVVNSAPDCSDFLLQAISNVANGSAASGNPTPMLPPTCTPGMLPPPGLLNSLGPQFFPGFYPDPFGWSMQQLPPPFFHGASLNPFNVPSMHWPMRAFQPTPYGYMPPTMPPPTPTFHGPVSTSGIPPPPMPTRVLCAAPPPGPLNSAGARNPSTPDNGVRYIPSTLTPQRQTTPANDPSTPDSDVVIVSPQLPARMRCIAARRVPTGGMRTPPARRESPVPAPSSAMRTPPAVDSLQALQASCNRLLGALKTSHANAGFQPEGSSESETATTPPTGSTLVEAPSTGQRLRQLLAATPRSSHVSVRARVTGIELCRSQTIGPPGPSRQRPIYRTEVGCPVPVGTVRQQRDRVERLCLLNPPTQLRPPSATYKRKATDLPSSTGLPRQVLGRLDNDAAGSPPKRQCSSRQTSEQAGNDENQPPQPGAPATSVERGVQTTVRIGVMGGSADWMLRGGIALNGSEGWRAAALREAYAAAMGYGGQDASPDLLLAWVREFIAFMRDFRADALAEHYFYGIVMRWLTRPVPNYGLPRRVPDDEGYVRRSVQHAVGIARRPNDPEYAAPLLYSWIMGWSTGIVSSRRAAAQAANAPPPPAGPQDPTSDL